jgi:hypothetical protein
MKKILSLFKSKKQVENQNIEKFDSLKLDNIVREKKDINLIIGDKIIEIKTLLEYRSVNDWLDTSIAFIKLERNGIICFPYSGDEKFENVITENNALPIIDQFQKIIYNQKIVDIYYELEDENEEFDDMKYGYLVLENEYVLEENRMSPSGTGGANMFCKTLKEFEEKMQKNQTKIYSVKTKEIKTYIE